MKLPSVCHFKMADLVFNDGEFLDILPFSLDSELNNPLLISGITRQI